MENAQFYELQGYATDEGLCKTIAPARRSRQFNEIAVPLQVRPIVLRQDLLRVYWIEDWEGIVVAGGHILNNVLGDEEAIRNGDVDVFFCGPEPRMPGNWRQTQRQWRDKWMTDKIVQLYWGLRRSQPFQRRLPTITYSQGCVNFLVEDVFPKGSADFRVQVVLRAPCADPHSLLQTFDLPNCQFAYRNGTVFATDAAIEYLKTGEIPYRAPKGGAFSDPTNPGTQRKRDHVEKYRARTYNTFVEPSATQLEKTNSFEQTVTDFYGAPMVGWPQKYADRIGQSVVLDQVEDVADFVALLM